MARQRGFTSRVFRFFFPYDTAEDGRDEWSMQRLYQEAGHFTVRNWAMAFVAATLAKSTREPMLLWLGLMAWGAVHAIMGAVAFAVYRHRDQYLERDDSE